MTGVQTCALPILRKVFIIDGRVPHALLIETLTDEGAGTMFKKEIEGNYVPRS